MDREGGVSMDAGQDVWDWEEVLPDDHSMSSSSSSCVGHEGSTNLLLAEGDDQGTKKELVVTPHPSSDADVEEQPVDECKDIGVVLEGDETKPSKDQEEEEEAVAADAVPTDPSADSDGREEGEKTPVGSERADEDGKADDDKEEEEDDTKKEDDDDNNGGKKKRRPAAHECVVFSVGKLKVNGLGALCSFGVAAATVCVFLIGGKMQQQHHHHRQQQQQQKIQLQFFGDDKRIQQVVQQTSRLNQAVSSMMGGGGGSPRATISFGGFYDGF